MNRSQIFTALALLCLFAAADAEEMENIEVVGQQTQRESLSDVDLSTYNGFASVISRDEFDNTYTELGPLINQLPSAQITQSGGIGSYSSVSVRGSTGKQVNVYLDGFLLNNPQSGGLDLSLIPTSVLDQIQVYPDFTPAQLVDANLGGAINLVTRRFNADTPLSGKVKINAGSFNTHGAEFSLWGSSENTETIIAGSWIDSANNYPIDRDVIFAEVGNYGESDERENAAFEQTSGLAKVRYHFSDNMNLDTLIKIGSSDKEIPTLFNKKNFYGELSTDDTLASLSFNHHGEHAWGAGVTYSEQDNLFTDEYGALSKANTEIKHRITQTSLNGHYEKSIADHKIAVAAGITQAKSEKKDLSVTNKDIGRHFVSERDKYDLAFSDQLQLTEAFNLTGIYRLTQYSDDSSKVTDSAINSSRCDTADNSCHYRRQTHANWQLGASYTQGSWTLKANTGKQTRLPTLSERFGEFGAFFGNAELEPEESENIEAGIIFDDSTWLLQTTVFRKELNNGIIIQYDASGAAKANNVGAAEVTGIEALLKLIVTEDITFELSGFALDSENNSQIKSDRGRKLPGFYHDSFRTALDWRIESHALNLSYSLDNNIYFIPSNRRKGSERKLLNLSYTYSFKQWSINTSLRNLLDERYIDYNFSPAPGRNYMITMSYEF